MDSDDDLGDPEMTIRRPTLAELSAPYQGSPINRWPAWSTSEPALPLSGINRKGKGPRGLVSMCLRKLIDCMFYTDPETIGVLPASLLWRLWREFTPREHKTLHQWECVAANLVPHCQEWLQEEEKVREEQRQNPHSHMAWDQYGQDEGGTLCMEMYRWDWDIYIPAERLIPSLRMPRKAAETCLTHLCLDQVERFPLDQLASIADLRLTLLELVQASEPQGNVVLKDQLCRAWARRAESAGGFSALRVLRITSKWHLMSNAGLMDLRSLPKLMIVDITRRPQSDRDPLPLNGRVPGWKRGPKGRTVFETYAQAYLGRCVKTYAGEAEDMKRMYKDKECPLMPIRDHRHLSPIEVYRLKRGSSDGEGTVERIWPAKDDGVDELDESTTLQTEADIRRMQATDDIPAWARVEETWRSSHIHPWEVFAWLGLVDYHTPDPEDAGKVQLEACKIPVPRKRFVHVWLRGTSGNPDAGVQKKGPKRYVFCRCREDDSGGENEQKDPAPSWAPRADDRRVKDLNARKRKRQDTVSDLLSSFGVPEGSNSSKRGT
ncbi:hypothetical protein VTJ49DRAFT_4187 [Mycothermus thermophilus]|uniref:Uncharacterized protein n=1 Tax=Humicola insolens TaxID=85995 RepID=A0ABR3V5Y6_HUMIN